MALNEIANDKDSFLFVTNAMLLASKNFLQIKTKLKIQTEVLVLDDAKKQELESSLSNVIEKWLEIIVHMHAYQPNLWPNPARIMKMLVAEIYDHAQKELGITTVSIVSTQKITEKTAQNLVQEEISKMEEKILKIHRFPINAVIIRDIVQSKSLIDGYVVYGPNWTIDKSIKGKLTALEKSLHG